MSSIVPTPVQNFYVHIGAPDPIILRLRANGALLPFDSSLKFTYVSQTGSVTLGVGSGITLSTDEGVANARATVQLSIAQSRAIFEGALTPYELQRNLTGREEVLLMGSLIGEGGRNPDG